MNVTLLPSVSAWWRAAKPLKFSTVPQASFTLNLLPPFCSVCFCRSIYDTPAGTAIRMNTAWGAWGAQFPRAGGKSVTVRNKNDQILSKLWQLLTTSHLLICSNAKLFLLIKLENRNEGKFESFQQHRRLYTWTSPDGQYQNQIDYILCCQRWRSSIQSAKKKTGSWLWLRSWTPYCQIQT